MGDQPTLAGLAVPDGPAGLTAPEEKSAPAGPVAAVVVDSHLAHLDRPFEYSVPAELAQRARPGVRVRVRFAGRLVDGFLLELRDQAEHSGKLAPLQKVVSDEVVLTPELARLCRQVADYYGGTLADVLRLAVPPRHARAEKSVPPADQAEPDQVEPDQLEPDQVEPEPRGKLTLPRLIEPWASYPAGPALVRRLAAGESPAAAWLAAPDAGAPTGWPGALAAAVAAVHNSGRGAVVVLPDHRDIDRIAAALDEVVGTAAYVRLTADLGPEKRYRAWLSVLRGHARIVIGSRSAAFAPVPNLGLVAWWDDGDDNLQEPRAPYPHVREILRRRAALAQAALIVGGYTRSVTIQHWVDQQLLPDVRPSTGHRLSPRVLVAGEGHQGARDAAAATARMPSLAWRAVKDGLLAGPVLMQVPRRGYVVGLRCEHCRSTLRCTTCAGPLRVATGGAGPQCAWCGRLDGGAPCRECGSTTRRSGALGEERTAEEVGRAFPGARVIVSRAGQVQASVPGRPAIVVATPGAEPVTEAGYAAVILLDGWSLLDRGGLDSALEALRRWTAAAALARADAPVVLAGVPPHAGLPAVEALVRWDSPWLARRELAERLALGLPPVRRTATLTGDPAAIDAAVQTLRAGPGGPSLEILGPLPVITHGPGEEHNHRVVVRPAQQNGIPAGAAPNAGLPRLLQDLRASRSLRKLPGDLLVQLDPPDLVL